MRLSLFKAIAAFATLSIAACCCSGPTSMTRIALASETKGGETIERDYLIQGMTCAGCVFGVKKALSRAGIEKEQIIEVDYSKPDPKRNIGHARVKFLPGSYRGLKTDCKLVAEIKRSPGYTAYWDPAVTDPCGLNKK
jgi:hypothetical protein